MGNKYGYNGAGGGKNVGGFGGGNMQSLMKQAQQMQQKLQEAQAELEELQVTGSASRRNGRGNGKRQKNRFGSKNQARSMRPDDVEMLEDLVLAAINDAYQKAQVKEDELMAPFAAMKGLL